VTDWRLAKKQEEFEEKLKFKNQFKTLDEDDVDYLVYPPLSRTASSPPKFKPF
jgi:hypothetical protein